MQVNTPGKTVPLGHPIKLMAQYVAANDDWRLHHSSASEISVEISGDYSDYTLTLAWQDSQAALQISVLLDIFITDRQRGAASEGIVRINSRAWMGHFELDGSGMVSFRHNLPLRGTGGATPEQIEDLLDMALGECERAYPALFQIATGVVSAKAAVDMVMLETAGSA